MYVYRSLSPCRVKAFHHASIENICSVIPPSRMLGHYFRSQRNTLGLQFLMASLPSVGKLDAMRVCFEILCLIEVVMNGT